LPIRENPQNIYMGEVFGLIISKFNPLEVIVIARLPLYMDAPL